MATVSTGFCSVKSSHLLKRHFLLLGYCGSGKTSALVTITGQEACRSGQPTVEPFFIEKTYKGRLLLLVDTPGWNLGSKDAAKEKLDYHNENVACIRNMCYPGLHAVLLVVPIGEAFTEHHRKDIIERMEAAGMDVWKYSLVLFTVADRLKGSSVEDYIAAGGTALQKLVERCRNQYHALDNTRKENSTQVNELLEKLEEMVQENKGSFFAMADEIHLHTSVRKTEQEENPRNSPAIDFSSLFRLPPRELRMLLVGWQGAGKSAAGNTILGGHKFESSCRTQISRLQQAHVNGRRVTIVDTPGWDWFSVKRTPNHIKKEIKRGASLLYPGPHALLLVIPAISTLTLRKRRALKKHLGMLDQDAFLHTIILFSCGDWLGCTIEEQIQKDGGHLLTLMAHCFNYYQVLDNTNKDRGQEQVVELLLKVEEMIQQNTNQPFLPVHLYEEQDVETTCEKCTLQ